MLDGDQTEGVESLGVEDHLFGEDDVARLLPILDYHDSFASNCNPIAAKTLAELLHSGRHPV